MMKYYITSLKGFITVMLCNELGPTFSFLSAYIKIPHHAHIGSHLA